jgi:hypothetical protein
MMAQEVEFDGARLRALALYVCHRCSRFQRFGTMKLSTVLWYADFEHYRRFGRAITGATYVRKPEGPVARELAVTLHDLVAGHLLEPVTAAHGDVEPRYRAPREPDLARFDGNAIAIVDRAIARFGSSAPKANAGVHEFLGWNLVENDEPIPYETALLGWRNPKKPRAASRIKSAGWHDTSSWPRIPLAAPLDI